MRQRATEVMAEAIEGTFTGPPADWTSEAEAALDALLGLLRGNAEEWYAATRRNNHSGLYMAHDLLAVMEESTP